MSPDILSNIPTLADEPEVSEADEKADRIAFHRTHVRNGPVSFKATTNGQEHRRKARASRRQAKKTRRAQVNAYFAQRAEIALLRAKLTLAGVIVGQGETRPTQALSSIVWIVQNFAEAEEGSDEVMVTYDVVMQALTSAWNRYQTLVGSETTPLSPEYRLPVLLSA